MKRSLLAIVSLSLFLYACGSGVEAPTTETAPTGSPATSAAPEVTATSLDPDAEPSENLTPVSFRLDWVVSGDHTFYYAGLEQGFFESEGLDVEILEGGGSALSIQLVANNTDHFAHADFGAMATAIDEGVPVTMVGNLWRRSPHVVVSLEETGIANPSDLIGKRVGVAPASSPAILFPAFLAANDIDQSEVEMVNLDPAAYYSALFEGQVDAILTFATAILPNFEIQGEDLGNPIAALYYADSGVITVSSGIIAHPDTIADQPELVSSMVRALQRSMQWTLENEDEAAEIMSERFPRSVSLEQARRSIEATKDVLYSDATEGEALLWTSPEDAQATLEVLSQYGDLAEIQDLDVYFTNDFIDDIDAS